MKLIRGGKRLLFNIVSGSRHVFIIIWFTARNIKFSHCENMRKDAKTAYFRIAKISSFLKYTKRENMRIDHVFANAKICEKRNFCKTKRFENMIFSERKHMKTQKQKISKRKLYNFRLSYISASFKKYHEVMDHYTLYREF